MEFQEQGNVEVGLGFGAKDLSALGRYLIISKTWVKVSGEDQSRIKLFVPRIYYKPQTDVARFVPLH